MFRIDKSQRGGRVTLTLAGVLDAGAVVKTGNAMVGPLRQNRKLILDLSELRHADREGILFLAAAMRKEVQLTGVPRYIRLWLRFER